jgi:polyisoprenoid-binding protein YceI
VLGPAFPFLRSCRPNLSSAVESHEVNRHGTEGTRSLLGAVQRVPRAPGSESKPSTEDKDMKILRSWASALTLLTTALLVSSAEAETTEWTLDSSHSRVGFTVSHLVVSSVSGRFKQVTGKVAVDEADLTRSRVEVTIKSDSIDTDEPKRDEHLRSADFFDTKKFPTLTFISTNITKAGGKKYKLKGDLALHGVTRETTLDAVVSDPIKNPWGKLVRAVKLSGKIKRSDFGLTWNKALETGGVVVGDEVTLDIQVEITK